MVTMPKVKVKCDNCGKSIEKWPFEVKKYKHHFCNGTCKGKWMCKQPKERAPNYRGGNTYVLCDNCGKKIEKVPAIAKNNNHNFCNRKCEGQWRSRHKRGKDNPNWKGGRREIICAFCGKRIERKLHEVKRSEHHFCNLKCQAKWQSKYQIGDKHPSWKGGLVIIKCAFCGKEKEVRPDLIKKGWGKYCSQSCNRKARKSFPQHHTKPELIFEVICKKHNLPFKYTGDSAFWIGKNPSVNPDFAECNGKKIAVEIFSYWHDPLRRHCKVPYSQTYKGRKKILKKYGWKLVVFWQEDLEREDAEQFILNKLKQEKAI